MTQPGIEPRSPGPLVNTLLIRLIAVHKYVYINIHMSVNKSLYVYHVLLGSCISFKYVGLNNRLILYIFLFFK